MSTPIVRRRKRPVEVDTIQWTGSNLDDLIDFTGGDFLLVDAIEGTFAPDITAKVYDNLHDTWVGVKTGQHVVRGVKGELYPIDEDVLADTYETCDGALAEGELLPKADVVAWLVKKAAEGTPIGDLASKVDRGAVRIFDGAGHYRDAMDAHRTEVLAEASEAADDIASQMRDKLGWPDKYAAPDAVAAVRAVAQEMRWLATVPTGAGEKATAAAATATPDFFQPGHTYTRQHHAATIRFLVRGVDTSPDGIHRIARGWRIEDGDAYWSPSDADDMDGWTDATEAGAR